MEAPRLGVDIGGTKVLFAAVWRERTELYRAPTGIAAGPEDIERELQTFLERIGARPSLVGVSVPGLVGENGRVVACDELPRLAGWQATALGGGAPAWALNDAEAGLLEETWDLPGATVALVLSGTGIGAALALDGVPFRGADGWAGELGSIPVLVGERSTTLDAVASGASLTARLGLDGETLARRAAAGDAEVLSAIREAGAALGLGLATLINLLNPRLVVVEGGTLALPGYFDAALDGAARSTLPELWRACTIRRSRCGETLAARGALRAAVLHQGEEPW
jgi:predicted NBD/HSP70 family sugar kinase